MDEQPQSMPGMASTLVIIGVLEIIGAAIVCAQVWPGDPGSGYTWKFSAYTPAFTWLFYGIIAGVLFFAGAAALTYLRDIREYLRTLSTTDKHKELVSCIADENIREIQEQDCQKNLTQEELDAQRRELMERYGIIFDGAKYMYQTHKYDNFQDALNYAKLTLEE